MRRGSFTIGLLVVGIVAAITTVLAASEPRKARNIGPVTQQASVERGSAKTVRRTSRKAGPTVTTTAAASDAEDTRSKFVASPRTLVTPISSLKRFGSGVAGVPPGTTVYRNELEGASQVYTPGADQLMADDLQLAGGTAGGGCDLVYYEIGVFGFGDPKGTDTVDIQTVLLDGNPCDAGSSVIAGTEGEFLGVANNDAFVLSVTPATPISIPGSIWLQVTFSRDDVGWFITERAELGTTADIWAEDNEDPPSQSVGCFNFFFGPNADDPHAGFWAVINCDLPADPTGACCDGSSCSELIEADCTAAGGSWRGAFTQCDPNNPCLNGACCTGSGFGTCSETSEATCFDGLFRPNATCDLDPCGPTHIGFANPFNTGSFALILAETKWADDMRLSTGQTNSAGVAELCELAGYEILVTGDANAGPDQFDAWLELWTNNPDEVSDELDTPLNPIPGTARHFRNIQADFFAHRLLAGAFEGIVLPEKVWIVLSTSSVTSGPLLGGPAKLGESLDAFAIFNPLGQNNWLGNFFFLPDGFDATGCPTEPTCNPAGSFRASIFCANDRPEGACCDDGTGTCSDNVTALECAGRLVTTVAAGGATCDADLFDPPCGTNACCFPNPLNPSAPDCRDVSLEECEALNGFVAAGLACGEFACPPVDCIGLTGDCLADNARPGCEDAFCCEQVCRLDDFCCSKRWDGGCVDRAVEVCDLPPANDDQADPEAITGQGQYTFDNTRATTDGPDNAGCAGIDDIEGITNDVWYCWTTPCTDIATIKTCGLTNLDTRLAVYEDCTQPPSDRTLLACNDDSCNYQSQVSFQAIVGQTYLIRVGTSPGMDGGSGSFNIRCGPLDNAACPGTVDCCVGTAQGRESPGCSDETCCERVCEDDPFCCNTDWDESCATTGFNDNGFGAAALCATLCGTCPTGPVQCLNPPDGVVDAGYPVDPNTGAPLGIQTIEVRAPHGAHEGCWRLCETNDTGSPNSIVSAVENLGTYTITLDRPITPNAVTTLTYTDALGQETTCSFTSHPGNVNGDDVTDGADVSILPQAFTGSVAAPWGLFSTDLDRDGAFHPADIMAGIDILLGVGQLDPALGTPKPSADGVCP